MPIILRYVEQVCAFVSLLKTKAGKAFRALSILKNSEDAKRNFDKNFSLIT